MKGKDGQSLERLFKRKFDLIEKLVRSTDDNGEEIDKIWKVMDKSLNKYGIVKYDAFEDMGGKLSFVLAMLDKNNTGFLVKLSILIFIIYVTILTYTKEARNFRKNLII